MNKTFFCALILCALPFAAFGQVGVADPAKVEVACPDDECHVAPFFKGYGGFVGEIAEGFDDVNFVVVCGLTSTSAMAEADSDGIVAQLLDMANGLGCAAGGSVEIHGLMDGGWYWITGDRSSAVASLVAKDVLGNDMVMPTDPGSSSITLEAMKDGATSIVTDTASGRMGILHHILPEPMMEAAASVICGPRYWAGSRRYYSNHTDCMLGNGGTMIAMTGPADTLTGRRTPIAAGGTVYRPTAAGATTSVTFGLWGNGSGHISTAPGATGAATASGSAAALKGWNISAAAGHVPAAFVSDFDVSIANSPSSSLSAAGITETAGDTLETTTPTVPVAGADSDDTTDGVQPDAAGGINSDSADGIDNGWGMHGGALVYCKQHTSRATDGDLLFHFAAASGGGTVLVNPDGVADDETGTPSEGEATPGSVEDADSWGDQLTWLELWNAAADNDRLISRAVADPDPAVEDDEVDVPEVVCATEDGTPKTTTATAGIMISPSLSHCGPTANHSVQLRISAPLGTARGRNQDIVPAISGARGVTAATTLNVMCPPSSANQGQELVPGNPRGTTRN